ncbi:MAG TPA: HAMP domain-containing sensor histidine kinase [Burkholderiaceae bacterium]|nr:HAMP domain-containing sensor histidine kinase [Burkholderiaceae bacterium]
MATPAQRPAASFAPPLLRQLHVQVSLAALALLVVMSLALMMLAWWNQGRFSNEVGQRLNMGLAGYVAMHEPQWFDAFGQPNPKAIAEHAHSVMMINPGVEMYLLDATGRIVGHGLPPHEVARERVDLTPIRSMLAAAKEGGSQLPVLGDDPRRRAGQSIFSVDELRRDGRLQGYLYLVLGGELYQSIADGLRSSYVMRQLAFGVIAATVLIAAVMVWTMRRLTRPLRQLARDMDAFRRDELADIEPPPGSDEIAVLRHAVGAMRARIEDQFRRLEQTDRMRRELISNISHDLHTPLARIQGFVETLLIREDQLDGATRRRHLETALRHCRSLNRRIADLFELSKLESARVELRCEPFVLAELIQDVVQGAQLDAQQRGIRLEMAPPGELAAALVRADIALIERVLQNLIDNALKYTPRGGEVKVSVQVRSEDSRLHVEISDTGAGIAPDDLPFVFERYFRAQAPPAAGAAQDADGTGLGLAIVKRILELHGSAVQVRSTPRQGTSFRFALPQA